MSNQPTSDPRNRGKSQTSLEEDNEAHQRPSPPALHPFQPIYPRPSHPLPPPPPDRTSMDPIACHVLDRRRIGKIGPEDRRAREPNSMARMRASVDGTMISPQTVYTGLHNPQTGLPAVLTGHMEGHLFAAPADDPLPKYGKHRQRDPYPSPADMASSWRKPTTVHAPAPFRPIALLPNPGSAPRAASSPENEVPGFRYLIHPENNPPAGANALPSLGLLRTGSNEPRQEVRQVPVGTGQRYDTPALPSLLMNTKPPLAGIPAMPAAPPSTPNDPPPAPPSSDGEQDMDISDDEKPMEDVETQSAPARQFTFGTATGPIAEAPRTVCVFNAFVTPDASAPSTVAPTPTPILTDKGNPPRAPLVRAQSLPPIATLDEHDMELEDLFTSPATSVPSSSSDEDGFASASSGDEDEKGEQINNNARADLVLIPDFGTGKHGPVVTREHYSSSPSFERKSLKEVLSDDEESLPLHLRALRRDVLQLQPHETTKDEDEGKEEESSGGSIPELVDPDSGSDDGRISSPEPQIELLAERPRPTGSCTVFTTEQLMRLINGHIIRLTQPAYAPTTSDFIRFGRLKTWVGKFEYEAQRYKNTEICDTARPLHDFFQVILAHPAILLESEKYPVHYMPVTEGELRRVSRVTYDGLHRLTPDSVLPRLFNGEIFREFGPETKDRDVALQAAIAVVVHRQPGVIACQSVLRGCLLEYNGLSLALIRRHGWKLDTTTCFHPIAKTAIPCLDTDENLQFRAVNHTLCKGNLKAREYSRVLARGIRR
ncbi:hypothetical protein DFH06DRAFT_1351848 [Mycena polygramma]|nr:hypothetical protein DFH06DRAFT_1351848 [Mycena polygramma]